MNTKWMMMAGLVGLCGMAQAEFLTIGDLGNTADTTGYGTVGYTYAISATEVTIAEFMASGAGDGDENYWNDGTCTVGSDAPASYVSLYEAMRYCNWLTSGSITNGLYEDKGGGVWGEKSDRGTVMAGSITYYAVPTEDEWYKAAYYTGNSSDYWSLYANGTDVVPGKGTTNGWNYGYANSSPNYTWAVGYGGEEQNGTYDMMGNVFEWVETASGVYRGGSYYNNEGNMRSSSRVSANPANERNYVGFRVVAIPEPASAMMLVFGAGIGLAVHRARRAAMRR